MRVDVCPSLHLNMLQYLNTSKTPTPATTSTSEETSTSMPNPDVTPIETVTNTTTTTTTTANANIKKQDSAAIAVAKSNPDIDETSATINIETSPLQNTKENKSTGEIDLSCNSEKPSNEDITDTHTD